ncbi:aminotransferase class V-fold PLP-dependent enzyme [Campylobacter sp. 19-13652]|uniref:aminotransferase class V-fold PLP-dependent enzyme n=1 Tax=Campylobacter sp. 19-13652 TaxID=2840180 RepID=UPI0021A646D7|nr:aminotransferase class V-fold PLP-dependent enzyme [Campylobacter sp. 19-13652]
MSLSQIRENIILKQGVHYFDFTASGLAYAPIEKRIADMLPEYANTHSESSSNSIKTQKLYEHAKSELKRLLGLGDEFYLMATGHGSSAAIKKFQELLGIYIPPATRRRLGMVRPENLPLVIVGAFEHHSNEVSWRSGLCEVVRIGLNDRGGINLNELKSVLSAAKAQNREIIASFSLASNVTGVIAEYAKISALVREAGGIMAYDAAAASPYMQIAARYFDALYLSPHKLLGGVGSCGLLAVRKGLFGFEKPTFAAGGTVSYVSRNSHKFIAQPERLEEGGTPPITQLVRAWLAYALREEVGLERIERTETELKQYFTARLEKVPNLINYCPRNQRRLGIFAFNIAGISPYELANALSERYGIQTRAGCACAGPYGHELLGLVDDAPLEQKPGWLRASVHYTHTKADIDYFIESLKECIKDFV